MLVLSIHVHFVVSEWMDCVSSFSQIFLIGLVSLPLRGEGPVWKLQSFAWARSDSSPILRLCEPFLLFGADQREALS